MKRILLFVLIIALCLSLVSCAKPANDDETELEPDYFTKVYGNFASSIRVVYDNATGVMYCMSSGSYNIGNLSPLYCPDGTLLTYDKYLEMKVQK